MSIKIENILAEVNQEVMTAHAQYPDMNSAHEGYAVLLEEVDELWDEVKVKQSNRSCESMRKEAIQVAAMACRFVLDICDKEGKYNV